MWKITLQDINTIPKKPKTQGHPTRNLWKRPKNNSKAWIKLSETILNILGDCWETFISSAPHSQQDWWKGSQPARCTYNPQPELLQKFSQQSYVVIGRHRAKFSPSVNSEISRHLTFVPAIPWSSEGYFRQLVNKEVFAFQYLYFLPPHAAILSIWEAYGSLHAFSNFQISRVITVKITGKLSTARRRSYAVRSIWITKGKGSISI